MSTKDYLEKDYYKVLGVSKDAKPDEIKKAFRKIARDNHPDQHPGDAAAEKRFKEASEANSVLSDAKKRKEYDATCQLGRFGFPGGGAGRPGPGGVNVEDLFRNASDGGLGDIFGNLFGQGGGAARRPGGRTARRGADVEGEVSIGFEEAFKGTTVSVQMVSDDACAACRGTGAKAGTVPEVCQTCQGSGMTASGAGGVFQVSQPCSDCRGRGLIVTDPCVVCHGSGRAKSTRSMQVRIPAGVEAEQKIRIKGKGSAGEHGGPAGDLYVTVHVASHRIFGRSGANLTLEAPVTFAEAALGAQIEVPTLEGQRVTLKLPAGTRSGQTLRVRGKGAPRSDGHRGDLLVTIQVDVPTQLSADQRTALEAFAATQRGEDVRAHLLKG